MFYVIYPINVQCIFFNHSDFRGFCCSTVLSALPMHAKLLKSNLILMTFGEIRISYQIKKCRKKIIKEVCSIFQICVFTVKCDWAVQESAPLCNEKQIEMVILSTGIPRFNVETQTKINVEKNCAN